MSDQHDTTKIAILDDYSTPPSSPLSISIFDTLFRSSSTAYGGGTVYPHTLNTRTPDGLAKAIERYMPYSIICTMRERTPFPQELIRGLPNLKLLLTTGTRNAAIDLDAANECGVIVAGTVPKPNSVKGYDSTNEQTWALILALSKNIPSDDLRVKAGEKHEGGWQHGINSGLAGKTLGLLGLGRLGAQCAVTGRLGFGMKVLAWSENLTQEKADQAAVARGLPHGSFCVAGSKEDLFRNADVLSVHYVLSERSIGIVSTEELGWMKKSAILVNTSRGPLIDETALAEALKSDRIRGVGLDVFDVEPLPADSVWRSQQWGKRAVLSPHMGYVEEETMRSWYEQQAENVRRYLAGEELLHVMTPKPKL